jgi:hypothetical protein
MDQDRRNNQYLDNGLAIFIGLEEAGAEQPA